MWLCSDFVVLMWVFEMDGKVGKFLQGARLAPMKGVLESPGTPLVDRFCECVSNCVGWVWDGLARWGWVGWLVVGLR